MVVDLISDKNLRQRGFTIKGNVFNEVFQSNAASVCRIHTIIFVICVNKVRTPNPKRVTKLDKFLTSNYKELYTNFR